MGTGCGGRCVGRVADTHARQPRPNTRRDQATSGRNPCCVRESPPDDDAHWTGRFHAAGSRRISDERAAIIDRRRSIMFCASSAEIPLSRGKRAGPIIDST